MQYYGLYLDVHAKPHLLIDSMRLSGPTGCVIVDHKCVMGSSRVYDRGSWVCDGDQRVCDRGSQIVIGNHGV